MRPTQMGLSLNVDLSSTVLVEPLHVIEFASQLLNRDVSFRTLSDADCAKIQNALKGVIVEVSHSAMIRRKYRIAGLTSQPTRELKFTENGTGIMKVVVEYFRETYTIKLKHTQLPCLKVGTQQKPRYLPMEVCKIVRQKYLKRLNERQITEFHKFTCPRPRERESGIRQIAQDYVYADNPYAKEFGIRISDKLASVEARIVIAQDYVYADNPYAKEFGIRISDKLASVEARILPPVPPRLKYHETGRETRCLPQVGQWSMVNKKLVDGGIVNNWLCINFAHNVGDNLASRFCYELTEMCRKSGMHFNRNPVLPVTSACTSQAERVLKRSYLEVQKLKKDLDLLIVILPDKNGSLYDLLYEILVVASQDWPEITKYVSLVSAQFHREELIQDLYKSGQDPDRGTKSGGMIKELLMSFYRSTGPKPQRIIFYRDGVGEGQFSRILLYELDAIRKACASLEANYQPPVTYVVVQKRHHTRLFANNHNDHNSVDRSGNILPGTVVDSQICHPTEFDFYLCSHASIKGTSRPTHYHVLWDENKFTADGLQTLTYNLCYTYARCTKSVSIVPPVYYAHLAASRARYYMEPETFDSEWRTSDNVAIMPLRALKENVQRVMYFC